MSNFYQTSSGLAPLPQDEPRAVAQVYAARVMGKKGRLAVHSWIATKENGASFYTTYQVIGYYALRGQEVVVARRSVPDAYWFGAKPDLVGEVRGEKADVAIEKIKAASKSYPYPKSYRIWPGPNSNSYISYILRKTPELRTHLPPHAVGKDWINRAHPIGVSESGTGFQLSLAGLLGFTLGLHEGIEINLLGMTFGFDVRRPALKLPFVGRVDLLTQLRKLSIKKRASSALDLPYRLIRRAR